LRGRGYRLGIGRGARRADRQMLLTGEEERMLSGAEGRAVGKGMQLIVALGEVFGAERLVRITSAQIAGVSYGNIGDAGLELLEDWASAGARVRVKATLNPAGMDLERWREMGVGEEYYGKQIRIIKAFERMGVETTCTCTPYLAGNLPSFGDHIAWSESSAVVYANSVLGARTNREGGPSALAAALTGRTPLYGLHLDEGRRATAIVEVGAELRSPHEFSLLGYAVGMRMGAGVPFFEGIKRAEVEDLKILSAALAASGGIGMFHMKGVTPEARFQDTAGLERILVSAQDLEKARERLSSHGEPDLACIGCPHCSVKELAEIARILEGRRVRAGKGLWVWTSRAAYDEAKRRGYVQAIEAAGGKVFADTCMVVCPLEASGFSHMVTNSCKAAHYVPSTSGMGASVRSLESAVSEVLEG